jgi:hypothetical protein
MTKYKEYFDRMVKENKTSFDNFAKLHMDYSMDEDTHQDEFNTEGEKILKIVHEWENRLCKNSENAGYSSYTGNLAEKFQEEVRSHFPLIDHIGIIVTSKTPSPQVAVAEVPAFNLKKIKL